MKTTNLTELERWARRAADDLREYADSGREAGTPMTTTEALLDELDAILAGRPLWQRRILERADDAPGIADLLLNGDG
jgi:hypothetical protein